MCNWVSKPKGIVTNIETIDISQLALLVDF